MLQDPGPDVCEIMSLLHDLPEDVVVGVLVLIAGDLQRRGQLSASDTCRVAALLERLLDQYDRAA